MKLDAKTVAALDPAGRSDVIFFDDALIGFGCRLRVGAGGRMIRSWVVQYRAAGVTRRYLVGSAEALGADQARGAARKVLARVALGDSARLNILGIISRDRLAS